MYIHGGIQLLCYTRTNPYYGLVSLLYGIDSLKFHENDIKKCNTTGKKQI